VPASGVPKPTVVGTPPGVASKNDVEGRIVELTAFLEEDPDDPVLMAQQTAAVDQLIALDHRIDQMSTSVALYGSGVQVYVEPVTPQSPIQPKPMRNTVIAFAAGALAASLWAWWQADSNRVAKDRNDPATVLHAPLLAAIPDFRMDRTSGPAPTISHPASAATVSYEFALSSIEFALDAMNGTSVLFTSVSPQDGKTTVALNLAIAATRNGHRPLLVDADERVRGLTFLSGLTTEAGLTDLNGSNDSGVPLQRWVFLDGTEIDFVPAGVAVPESTAGLFGSGAFRKSLGTLIDGWPIVFIDSPPVMAAAETAALAAVADAVVLVVSEGTNLKDLENARDRLSISPSPIIGYIFNRATSSTGIAGYGYVGNE
jgi:succinoglycan biosynthesis transport protein ExoP